MRIKQKVSSGIPRHEIDAKMVGNNKVKNRSLDVENVGTSNDLINILEHDHLVDVQQVDINDYLQSIATITYEEAYDDYINCVVCIRRKYYALGLN